MAELTIGLDKGIAIGDARHVECVVREAVAQDLMLAARAAEVVVLAPTGRVGPHGDLYEPAVLINPYLMEMHTLRRQIVRIGAVEGPLEDAHWNLLSETDIALIKAATDLLARAQTAPAEVALRGRTEDHRASGGEPEQPVGADQPVDQD